VKASLHPQPVKRLNFHSRHHTDVYQREDIRVWVKFRDGDLIDIDEFVSRLESYTGKELAQDLYLRSWVTILKSAVVRPSDDAAVGTGGIYMFAEFPDYPMYQPRNDLVAVHIGSSLLWHESQDVATQALEKSTTVQCLFLILEKHDELTWRRVGVQSGCRTIFGEHTTQDNVPKAQDFIVNIDMKGIWGVRDKWELRTLCLI
jgi:hypothetical protein